MGSSQSSHQRHVAVFGLALAGKTSLIKQFHPSPAIVTAAVTQTDTHKISAGFTTLTFDYPSTDSKLSQTHQWTVFDLDSSPVSHELWATGTHSAGTTGIIFVMDGSDRSTPLNHHSPTAKMLSAALKKTGKATGSAAAAAAGGSGGRSGGAQAVALPLLIFINKYELAGGYTPADVSKGLKLFSYADKKYAPDQTELVLPGPTRLQLCSASTGAGVAQGLEWLNAAMSDRKSVQPGVSFGSEPVAPTTTAATNTTATGTGSAAAGSNTGGGGGSAAAATAGQSGEASNTLAILNVQRAKSTGGSESDRSVSMQNRQLPP